MTGETLAEELIAIEAGACAACANAPATGGGFCDCCNEIQAEIDASTTGTITFQRCLEIIDSHDRLTNEQRALWLTPEEGSDGSG